MAGAFWRATGTTGVNSGTTSVVPTMPSAFPDDLLLLFVTTANQGSDGTASTEIPAPSGWSLLSGTGVASTGQGTAAGATATRLSVFWLHYDGTQGAPTVQGTGTPSPAWDHVAAVIHSFGGIDWAATNVWDVAQGGTEAVSDTSLSATGVTTSANNELVVVASACETDIATARLSGWTNGNLTSFTERSDGATTSGSGGGIGVATGVMAIAGATGASTSTYATATLKSFVTIALTNAQLIDTLVQDFSSTPGDWSFTAAASVTSGELVINHTSNGQYEGAWGVKKYECDGGTVIAKWVSTAANPNGSYMRLTCDVTNANDEVAVQYDDTLGTNVQLYYIIGGSQTFVGSPVSYDGSKPWIRLRVTGGNLVADMASDFAFTAPTSIGTISAATAMPQGTFRNLEFVAGGTGVVSTSFHVDNVNTAGTTTKSLSDSGSSSESLTVSATVPLADSGSGTESVAIARLAETGSSIQVIAVAGTNTLAETASSVQAISVTATVPLSDGTASPTVDSLVAGVAIAFADSGSATQALSTSAAIPLAASGSAVDTFSVPQLIGLFQTGGISEALSVVVVTPLPDSGSASDSFVGNTKALATSGSAAESQAITAFINLDESADSFSLPTETGAATDTLSVTKIVVLETKSLTETGAASDTLLVIKLPTVTISLFETASSADTLSTTIVPPGMSDSGTADDIIRITVQVALRETGHEVGRIPESLPMGMWAGPAGLLSETRVVRARLRVRRTYAAYQGPASIKVGGGS